VPSCHVPSIQRGTEVRPASFGQLAKHIKVNPDSPCTTPGQRTTDCKSSSAPKTACCCPAGHIALQSTPFDSTAALSGHVKGTCTFFCLYINTAGHDSQLQQPVSATRHLEKSRVSFCHRAACTSSPLIAVHLVRNRKPAAHL
jgi:hypothetical protein